MEGDDFFCDGQSQSGAAGVGVAGFVHAEEFFKDGVQFFCRNGSALIDKANENIFFTFACIDLDRGVGIAVGDGVFQNIVEHSGKFHGVSVDGKVFFGL